jgi:hypothetical protein
MIETLPLPVETFKVKPENTLRLRYKHREVDNVKEKIIAVFRINTM